MTFLFFAGLVLTILGAAEMNWLLLVLGIPSLLWAIAKLDERIERDNRLRMEMQHQEAMAKKNGHPSGNVELVRRDG